MAVRLLQRQYTQHVPLWREMHATLVAQAEMLDRHSDALHKIKGAGDFLHIEVAKAASVQTGIRGNQETLVSGVQEAHVKCDSLHDDCARLTGELQSRDAQIADAVARCHMMASANNAAMQMLSDSVQEIRAQASPAVTVEAVRGLVATETSTFAAASKANFVEFAQGVQTRITNLASNTEEAIKGREAAMAMASKTADAPVRAPPGVAPLLQFLDPRAMDETVRKAPVEG